MNALLHFRKSITLPLIGFLLAYFAQSAQSVTSSTDEVAAVLPDVSQRYDFNGDGHPDYVLSNEGTGQTAIWYLNNNVYLGGALAPSKPIGAWVLIDAADFNGNGHPDYAWFNRSFNGDNSHQTAIWYLNNNVFINGLYGPTTPPFLWKLVAVGDFNGDGKPDYVLYNSNTLQTAIWYLNNNVYVSGGYGPTLPLEWQIVGVADFDSNGHTDYLLYNTATRHTAIWYLSGRTLDRGAYGPTITGGYQLIGAADYNGDGHPDYALFNPNTLQTKIWYLNNNNFMSEAAGPTLPSGWSLHLP